MKQKLFSLLLAIVAGITTISASIDTVRVCLGDTYIWCNQEISLDVIGTYEYTCGENILVLNVMPPSIQHVSDTIYAGEEYIWNGKNLTETGAYYDTLTNAWGCDSITVLFLTIIEKEEEECLPTYGEEKTTICEGEVYTWNEMTLYNPGTYNATLVNIAGCDSIVTLYLNVLPSYNVQTVDTIYEGETYMWEGQTLTQTGLYPSHYVNSFGCDSIVTLKLIVIKNATPIETTPDEVAIEPSNDEVAISWPQVEDAYTYELIISDKQGNIVCSVTFNSNGVLINIRFRSPSRNHKEQVQGFSFTITGLDDNTEYTYTLTAKDDNGQEIEKFENDFHTTAQVPTSLNESDSQTSAFTIKTIDNNMVVIVLPDGSIYNLQGVKVK